MNNGMMCVIGILVVIIAGCLIENKRELRTFRIKKYLVTSEKLKGLRRKRRIVFLSDLHNYSYGEHNEKLLKAIREVRPDVILIGGDMLVRKDGTSYEETLQFLCCLPQIAPVYCANGNHEQRLKEYPEKYEQSYQTYRNCLIRSGIRMLENDSVTFCWDDIPVTVTGLEIPLEGYQKFRHPKIERKEIEDRVGTATAAYQILLAHHPAYVPVYKEWGADLILSGHLHGGVVRLPGIGGVIGPDFILFPRYSGDIYREDGKTVVVSKGLGAHTVSVRIFNPAELVVLEFPPEESEKADGRRRRDRR